MLKRTNNHEALKIHTIMTKFPKTGGTELWKKIHHQNHNMNHNMEIRININMNMNRESA